MKQAIKQLTKMWREVEYKIFRSMVTKTGHAFSPLWIKYLQYAKCQKRFRQWWTWRLIRLIEKFNLACDKKALSLRDDEDTWSRSRVND